MFKNYVRNLSTGRLILWCYFVWYLAVLVRYFDPNPLLWLTSLGLSAIIGLALYISTTASSTNHVTLDRWQTFRLFLMPFCVSSFAALVKGRGFILIFSPRLWENAAILSACLVLVAVVLLTKRFGANIEPKGLKHRSPGTTHREFSSDLKGPKTRREP